MSSEMQGQMWWPGSSGKFLEQSRYRLAVGCTGILFGMALGISSSLAQTVGDSSAQDAAETIPSAPAPAQFLRIRGIYPHLATFNTPEGVTPHGKHGECGIGAVVPWAGKLWYITYPPHQRQGSQDKLYEVDSFLRRREHPASVGGTHANRLIHRESQQLIIGYHWIDQAGNVRTIDPKQMPGRMTATARHLTDPANKVYFYDMEGTVYEVDVHSLAVNELFKKPVPGWHGKGAYTGQGRFVVANNGESASPERNYDNLLVGGPAKGDEAGVLAAWDGKDWQIIERKQFTDVTGPGGIAGNETDDEPIWSIGWDRRSVLLKMLDGGVWYTYRLLKGSHTFDPRHGWFTEWPRIRPITASQALMVMHGTLFDFPLHFAADRATGIRPLATHLRYIPDFCEWRGQLLLAADDASFMQNPLVGQPQSNLWFGSVAEVKKFGPCAGWGGPWLGDRVEPENPSDPLLIAGYGQRTLHLSHGASGAVLFTIELAKRGTTDWQIWRQVNVPAKTYVPVILPTDLNAEWLRCQVNRPCVATAYLHAWTPNQEDPAAPILFAGIADLEDSNYSTGIIRTASHNRSLQFLSSQQPQSRESSKAISTNRISYAGEQYYEIKLNEAGTGLEFTQPQPTRVAELKQVATIQPCCTVEAHSILVVDAAGQRFRLPKGPDAFDALMSNQEVRGLREAVSERYLANLHGTFYEIPRDRKHGPDWEFIKPICSHRKRIGDFCTWRGLLVLTGVRAAASNDGQTFRSASTSNEPEVGLWFGMIDDLWRLGKPVGKGGPWSNSSVVANTSSDPYLMTGYDRKLLHLSHQSPTTVQITVEINFNHRSWHHYQTFAVPTNTTITHAFEPGYHAHWLRLWADQNCTATAELIYD